MARKNRSTKFARTRALIDTQVIYCGDNIDQLSKLPDASVDLIYIDPSFNSNRNYEVFWNEKREMRSFDDRHASTQAYIDFMRPRCVELARVLKPTGTFYYHCDWQIANSGSKFDAFEVILPSAFKSPFSKRLLLPSLIRLCSRMRKCLHNFEGSGFQ